MAALILPRRFNSQPQGAVDIDWGNPLTGKLTEVLNPSSPGSVTSIRGVTPSVIGNVLPAVGGVGAGVLLPTTYDSGLVIASSSDDLFASKSEVTIFVVRRPIDITKRASTLFGYSSSNISRVICHAPWTDGNIYFDYGGTDAAQRILSSNYTKKTSTEYLVFVAGGGKGREIWRDGVKLAGDVTKTGVRTLDSAQFKIGAANNSFSSDLEEIYLFGVASRAWSDSEIKDWSSNPWQLFRPQKRTLYFDVSTPGIPILSLPGVDQITTTGARPYVSLGF